MPLLASLPSKSGLRSKSGLALVIGSIGAALAYSVDMPLAFMLGAIFATSLAALTQLPIAKPSWQLIDFMRATLGVMLGSGVSPELLHQAGQLLGLMAFVPVYVALITVFGCWYFRALVKLSWGEAFFAALPGGVYTMTAYAESMGLDVKRVALVHTLRIVLVVFSLPFLISWLEGVTIGAKPPIAQSVLSFPLHEWLLLSAAGIVGYFGARFIKMPGGTILGPMIFSAIIHGIGWSQSPPPAELVIMAQVVLGVGLGVRFLGETFASVFKVLAQSLGFVVGTLGVTVGIAILIKIWLGTAWQVTLIGFAPGGLSEMALVALSLNIDIGMIAVLHVVRLLLIMVAGPFIFQGLSYLFKEAFAPPKS